MEPIVGACKFRADLEKPVGASDVGKFVRENDAAAFGRPSAGAGGKKNRGPENAPGKRHRRRVRGMEETDRASYAKRFRDLGDAGGPRFVADGPRFLRNRGHAYESAEEAEGYDAC